MRINGLIFVGILYVFQVGCNMEREMNRDQFWKIIERAEDKNGLRTALLASDRETVLGYYLQFQERMRESNTGDVWAAARLLNAGHCSDDCFEYFRCWLVSKGQGTFERALVSADTLSEIGVPFVDGYPAAQDEGFCYVAPDVYKEITKENLFEVVQRLNQAVTGGYSTSFDWRMYTAEVVKEKLPNLWKKYSSYSMAGSGGLSREKAYVSKVDIPGVGLVGEGDLLRHEKFGVGVVKTVFPGPPHAALIQFADSERTLVLDAGYINKQKESE